MSDPNSPPTWTQELLSRLVSGDEGALEALLRHNSERLARLARRMLGAYPRVKRWADTDDVLQSALVRLLNALRSVKPTGAREFLALAALQIRRELIDLARRYYGPEGIGANHESGAAGATRLEGTAERGDDSATLARWHELHQQIELLAAEEREVVGLIFYQGLSQADAAEVLGVSVRTVQRRWHVALRQLHRVWQGEE